MSIAAITLPQQLDDLRGEICQMLPPYEAEDWRQRFNDAADTNLQNVWPQFARWLLLDDEHGVYQYADTDERRNLIVRAAMGNVIDYDVIFSTVVSATGAGYAAAYSANRAAIYRSAYPAAYALYVAAHVSADRADLAAHSHATAHFAAGKPDAAKAQAAELIRLMEVA